MVVLLRSTRTRMAFNVHLRKDLSRALLVTETRARARPITWAQDNEDACLAGRFVDGLEGTPVVEVDHTAGGVGQTH